MNRNRSLQLTLLAHLMSCASGEQIVMPPKVVQVRPDPVSQLTEYDAPKLFQLAREADQQKRLEDAAQLYIKLLDEFPQSDYELAARFNLGLVYEQAEAYEQASQEYIRIVNLDRPDKAYDERTWRDAHFRLAVTAGKAKDWGTSIVMFNAVLEEQGDTMTEFDVMEALVGKGIAQQEYGDPEGASLTFMRALRHHREVSNTMRFDDQGLAAEAAFRMGEIIAEDYYALKLEFPPEHLKQTLEEKCGYLLAAQHRYLRAMRHGDAHTVAAAGFRIGALYESLYDMIVELRVPEELDADQRAIYRDEVRKRVHVLVKKALRVYERALAVGSRANTAARWTQRLQKAIARLQTLYLEGEGLLGGR